MVRGFFSSMKQTYFGNGSDAWGIKRVLQEKKKRKEGKKNGM
jgi:hypothetical protein